VNVVIVCVCACVLCVWSTMGFLFGQFCVTVCISDGLYGCVYAVRVYVYVFCV